MKYYIFLLALLGIGFAGCKKPEQETLTPKITNDNVEVTATTATFTWTVEWPGKLISVVEVSENEDMSNSKMYGYETETETHDFKVTVTNLKAATKYYYRFLVWNQFYVNDKYVMEMKECTTHGFPVVKSCTVPYIDWKTAECIGEVIDDGGDNRPTERGFCWSTSENPTLDDNYTMSNPGTGIYKTIIIGLSPNTEYIFRAYARNDAGVSYGDAIRYTTKEGPCTPEGAVNGVFSVSLYKQVHFSQGNLQYQASTNTWRFAEHQYDTIGKGNNYISSYYSGWIDLFGWGTSGYNHGAVCYQPWSTSKNPYDYYAYGNSNFSLFDQNGKADWGYNAISNGGNEEDLWHTLTKEEWDYLINERNTYSRYSYAYATVAGIKGMLLLPDDWNPALFPIDYNWDGIDNNVISIGDWNTLEQIGVVFLPAAGYRFMGGHQTYDTGVYGKYWSSSRETDDNSAASIVRFDFDYALCPWITSECVDGGCCVRLTCPVL